MKFNKIFYTIFSIYIFIMLLLGLCFLSTIIANSPNYFSDSSAHYFYSALFQANAAIISILGVFFIFRLQAHHATIGLIKNGLLADQGRNSWPTEIIAWDGYTLEEKEQLLKDDKTNRAGSKNERIFVQLSNWTKKERKLYSLQKTIITPLVFIALVMMFETLCLFSATYIHLLGLEKEIFVMYINLVLESSILILVVYHIVINITSNVV